MNVFVSFDGDGIGQQVGRASLANAVDDIRRISQDIDRGNELWRSWALSTGGSIVSIGGDEGRLEIPADHLDDLPDLRIRYGETVGATVSVGVGMDVSEADRALLYAKINGKDRIVLFDDIVAEAIADLEERERKNPKSEVDKIGEEYLKSEMLMKAGGPLRAAGFMHAPSGKIYESGPMHDIEAIPNQEHYFSNPEEYVEGFVTHAGKFLNRAQAAKAVGFKSPVRDFAFGVRAKGLASEDPESGLNKADPLNQGPGAGMSGGQRPAAASKPTGEASEHSQGEAAQAQLEEAPPPAEQTHANQDFEDQFHELAQAQGQQDQQEQDGQAAQAQGGEETRAQIIKVLEKVKAAAPVLEQVKAQAPQVYEAVVGAVKAMLDMAHQLHPEGMAKSEGLEKMALVHDDRQNPTTVYRVQNKEGRGPYEMWRREGNHYNGPIGKIISQAPIHGEQGLHPDADFSDDARAWNDQDHSRGLYGFEKPEHAEAWFGKEGMKGLQAQGFSVVPRQAGRVHRSRSGQQVLFMPTDQSTPKTWQRSGASMQKALPVPKAPSLKHALKLPVGSTRDGKVKVRHGDSGKSGWVSVRAGEILSHDGHPISSLNPGGR